MLSLEDRVKKLYEANHRVGESHGVHYDYTCPSPTFYPFQWLWDSSFHSIAMSHFDIGRAKREIKTLLLSQRKDGFIPCVSVWWGVNPILKLFYVTEITQPPVVPISIEAIYRKSKDKSFLAEVYPKLKLFMSWLSEERDGNKNGLIEIIHPWETGIDATPSFDAQLGIKEINPSFLKFLWLYASLALKYYLLGWNSKKMLNKGLFVNEELLFNCIYAKSLKVMARLAGELDQTIDKKLFEKRYSQVKAAILKNYWSEKDKIFYNLDENSHQVRIKTISSLMPLILDDLPGKYVKSLVEKHLLNKKEFWSEFPIPSVSMSEKTFNPGKNLVLWRGPVWTNINWFISKALLHGGYSKEAKHIFDRTIKMIDLSGFREHYNPLTGEGHGQKNFTWPALVLDIYENKS